MWNVRLYFETHLNTANTLDNATLLETARHLDVPALDLLQAEGLTDIKVKATRAQVKNVEYVKLTDTESGDYFYYEAGIPKASSVDVQIIPLIVDGVLTMSARYNGIQNIPFLDGIITRHHVAKENDVYGAYTEEDPLLIPSKELEMDIREFFDDSGDNTNIVVESTIALDTQANHYEASVYTDSASGEQVTVPTVVAVPTNSRAVFGDVGGPTYHTAGTEYFDGKNTTVQKGISAVRGLGVESGILNSYVLPESQATMVPTATGQILTIQGVRDAEDSTLNFEYANVDNKRVLYGALNSLELVSVASGMRASFKPEDIRQGESGNSPTIIKITDPRPNGRPYFMFRYFKGEENEYNCLQNAIAGMEWANAPLVYTGRSGSTLDQISLKTSQRLMNIEQGQAEYNNSMALQRALTGQLSSGIGMAGGLASSNYGIQGALQNQSQATRNVLQFGYNSPWAGPQFDQARLSADKAINVAGINLVTGIAQSALGLANAGVDYFANRSYLTSVYGARMAQEMAQYAIGQVTAPALNFPRSETLRDFLGNGVLVIRYRPNATDIQKLDRILTMYGYKDTMPLIGGESVFTNRSKFNYVAIQGVTIGGDAPRWLREATAAQLSAGVRVWHVIPDRTAYNSGENV